MSIYDAIGGEAAVGAVVDELYRRLLNDSALKGYFDGVDMDQLARHQRAFITAALGGPGPYTGRAMGVAHTGLGITDDAFDRVAEHLVAILRERGVDEATVGQIGDGLAPLRPDIVTA